ncbi:MAG: cation:proton antiporter [Acidimicrobiia bacterium]
MTRDALLAFVVERPRGPAVVFLAVTAAAFAGQRVAQALRLAPVIGLLGFGYAIGPHGLSVVPATDTLAPALGQIGLLYIVFLAALQLDVHHVLRRWRPTAVLALLLYAVPFGLGFVAGTEVLGYGVAASVLLGSLWSSQSLEVLPTYRRAGFGTDPAVVATAGATALTDTVSLVVLAGVARYATRGTTGLDLVVQLVVALAVVAALSAFALPALGRLLLAHLHDHPPARFLFAMTSMAAMAALAEALGIEAVVGAFLAGLGLNRMYPDGGPSLARVEFFGTTLLIPLFTVSIGMLIDPALLWSSSALEFVAAFVVVLLAGKAVASVAGRMAFGYAPGQAALVWTLAVTHGAATLASAFVAFEIGLVGTGAITAVLVIVVVSNQVGALGARYLVPRVPHRGPPPPPGARVLVDVGERPDEVLRLARAVAEPDGGVILPVVVHVVGRDGPDREPAVVRAAERLGLDCEVLHRGGLSHADVLVGTATVERATVVLVPESAHAGQGGSGWAPGTGAATWWRVVPLDGEGGGVAIRPWTAAPGGEGAAVELLRHQLGEAGMQVTVAGPDLIEARWPRPARGTVEPDPAG